jgi:hypothetical protein
MEVLVLALKVEGKTKGRGWRRRATLRKPNERTIACTHTHRLLR